MRILSLNNLAAGAFALLMAVAQAASGAPQDVCLNGQWETGLNRDYTNQTLVPGLAQSPAEMSPDTLWYRRVILLPEGNWTLATLRLNGARFAPSVYVDGEKLSESEGGMAPIEIPLRSGRVAPGKTIQLELALKSLRDLDPLDASAVPVADRWRSDNSSDLWDTVALHFSGEGRISRSVPWTDFHNKRVSVHWETDCGKHPTAAREIQAQVLTLSGALLAQSSKMDIRTNRGVLEFSLNQDLKPWTPETPNVFRLRLVLSSHNQVEDIREINWGLRDFRTAALRFMLNEAPIQLRGGSVVWHRWLRDPEARTVAFAPGWFETNIVLRLKGYGANFLRFHLGLPPESFLDLCDHDGLMVQMEWPFFHGVKASPQSMEKQWRTWLDVGMRHPSVVLIHPWNETEGDELAKAWNALNSVLPDYPPLVVSHRDVIPIHKYWWSLFENLGLYYDSAEQFPQPIMVDEFGGNYLDSHGDTGGNPVVKECLLRFLGRDQTREGRLEFQAQSHARIAEYWRRLGAAGFAPFCILSSPQDGNTWFLDDLSEGKPKPVWNAMAAAYTPLSLSLEVWDRNYPPGQSVALPLYLFNDTGLAQDLDATVRIVSTESPCRILSTQSLNQNVPPHSTRKLSVQITMPSEVGKWRLEAQLNNPAHTGTGPVVSSWDCRTLEVKVPAQLRGAIVGLSSEDSELKTFFSQNGIATTNLESRAARVLVLSAQSWAKLPESPALLRKLQEAVDKGTSVVLLDIGPRDLGQGYKGDLGPLEGAPKIKDPYVHHYNLFSGIRLSFTEAPEPESHLHPPPNEDSLWASLPRDATWIWNGLRAGLIVPSADMDVTGLSSSAFVSLWVSRGADERAIRNETNYFAYQLAGYYAFSAAKMDKAVIADLRAKVKLLAEDAPSLQDRINPNAPVECTDIAQTYRLSGSECKATQLLPLANCGKNLTRVPVAELAFGPSSGSVVLSQVLTAGRLIRGQAEPGLYGIRYDPAAEQFTLNLVARVVKERLAAR
jgi:hypothetical protein